MSSQDEEKSSRETKETLTTDEHLVKLDDLVLKLNTNIEEGLTTKQASKKLDKDGLNEISTSQKESLLGIFMKNQFGGFSLIFWIAGAFCFLLALGIKSYVKEEEYYLILYLGIARCVVVHLAGIYSFYEEYKADETMEKVKNMIPLRANVLRDGKWKDIEASQLVKGDIVEIKQGDKVPADLRIIEADMLKVDISNLTGESVAVSLDPKKLNEDAAESKNVAFCSTNITEGFGKGIVTQTGDKTRIGSIAKHKQEETTTNTEIQNFIHLTTQNLTALVMFTLQLKTLQLWLCFLISQFSRISTHKSNYL